MMNEIKRKLNVSDYAFEITGVDMNIEFESWFSFELKMKIDELNNYSKMPVNIIDKVIDCETFIKRPNCENSSYLDFEYPKKNTKRYVFKYI